MPEPKTLPQGCEPSTQERPSELQYAWLGRAERLLSAFERTPLVTGSALHGVPPPELAPRSALPPKPVPPGAPPPPVLRGAPPAKPAPPGALPPKPAAPGAPPPKPGLRGGSPPPVLRGGAAPTPPASLSLGFVLMAADYLWDQHGEAAAFSKLDVRGFAQRCHALLSRDGIAAAFCQTLLTFYAYLVEVGEVDPGAAQAITAQLLAVQEALPRR